MRRVCLSHETSFSKHLVDSSLDQITPGPGQQQKAGEEEGRKNTAWGSLALLLGHLHGASCLHAKKLA